MLFREGIQITSLVHGAVARFSFCFSVDLCYNYGRSNGFLAQLVRATGLHPVGRGFDSLGTHIITEKGRASLPFSVMLRSSIFLYYPSLLKSCNGLLKLCLFFVGELFTIALNG